MAYQIAAKGSFDANNYELSFATVNISCIAMIVIGTGGMIIFALKQNNEVE